MNAPIGGFFELELPQTRPQETLLSHWKSDNNNSLYLHNARSCLHYLMQHLNAPRLWLPAYCCAELASDTAIPINFYPLNDQLSPDTAFLKNNLRAHDAVLAIDYFGRSPGKDFIDFTKNYTDVHWIEDCAHALQPNTYWGQWILYSPRKLCGVPDGGILVNRTENRSLPSMKPRGYEGSSIDFMKATLMRFENAVQQADNPAYEAFIAAEKTMHISPQPMSQLTHRLLNLLNPLPIIEQRQRNYNYLQESLDDLCFFQQEALDFVPSGFPIQLPAKLRDKVFHNFCQQHIFAQRHWNQLPSDAEQFPWEHQLSQELLTLPCDHRYDIHHMERMVDVLETL